MKGCNGHIVLEPQLTSMTKAQPFLLTPHQSDMWTVPVHASSLFAFLSPTQELLKICFREHFHKMAEAVMKSPSSLQDIFTFLFYFPKFFSFFSFLSSLLFFFFFFLFSQLLLLCGRPKSKQVVSTRALKIMTPQVALPSWKMEFCCLRQSARKDQAPVYWKHHQEQRKLKCWETERESTEREAEALRGKVASSASWILFLKSLKQNEEDFK